MSPLATIIIVLAIALSLVGLALALRPKREQDQSSVTVRTASGERLELTGEAAETAVRQFAQAHIDGVKARMAELRAQFEDPTQVDLSNIEEHVAKAEQQIAAKQYREAIATCFGPLTALGDALADIKLNGRGGKLVSMKISVSSGRDESGK